MPSRETLVAVLILLVAVGVRAAVPAVAVVSYVLVAGYALAGPAYAVRALAMSWLITMVNDGVPEEAAAISAGRYVVIGAAAVSVGLRGVLTEAPTRITRTVLATLLLGGFLLAHALAFSEEPVVSLLKAVVWVIAVATLLSAWGRLGQRDREELSSQIGWLLLAVGTGSVPMLFTRLGYLRNNIGFQGVLNHPQAFGATMALLGAWVAGDILRERAVSLARVLTLGAIAGAVLLSESRTAGIAMAGGVALGVLSMIISPKMRTTQEIPALRSRRVPLWALAGASALMVSGPLVGKMVTQFVQKRSETISVPEAYEASRGALIRRMWANIEARPMQGIGFGIASDPSSMTVARDSLFGLPIGASVEKGVTPVAVLEELGIPGFLVVAAWVVMLVRRAVGGGIKTAIVMWACLLLNFGEAVLFSPGGLGLLVLMLVAWAGTARRTSDAGAEVYG